MTPEQVRARVAEIRGLEKDKAIGLERALWRDVLTAISDPNQEGAVRLAIEALKTCYSTGT